MIIAPADGITMLLPHRRPMNQSANYSDVQNEPLDLYLYSGKCHCLHVPLSIYDELPQCISMVLSG
jgi:hypothetical protein